MSGSKPGYLLTVEPVNSLRSSAAAELATTHNRARAQLEITVFMSNSSVANAIVGGLWIPVQFRNRGCSNAVRRLLRLSQLTLINSAYSCMNAPVQKYCD